MENKETFKQLIKKHGFNLSSLAKKLDINKSSTHYWVKYRAIPRRETLEKCAEILGESIDTIVAAIANS